MHESWGHLCSLEGVEHAEAVVEVSLAVAVDLPGEGKGYLQLLIHVVCCCAVCQVPCTQQGPSHEDAVASNADRITVLLTKFSFQEIQSPRKIEFHDRMKYFL